MSKQTLSDKNLKKIFIVTLKGTAVNFFLAVAKIFVGLKFKVDAVLADGVQSLADLVSDTMLLVAVKFSYQPRSRARPFGNRKLETLSALVISIILALTALGLIRRGFYAPDPVEFILLPALIVSLISVISKEILFRYTLKHGKLLNSPAVVANGWSHRADALSSGAVAVCIIMGMLFGYFSFWDKVGVVIVSILILRAAWKIARDALSELLDYAPSEEVMLLVESIIDQDPEVVFVHNVRVRSVAGTLDISCTIEVDGSITVQQGTLIARRVEQRLMEGLEGVAGVMIRVLPAGSFAHKVRKQGIENVSGEELV